MSELHAKTAIALRICPAAVEQSLYLLFRLEKLEFTVLFADSTWLVGMRDARSKGNRTLARHHHVCWCMRVQAHVHALTTLAEIERAGLD